MTDAEIRAKAEKIANSEHGKAMAESWNQISAEQTYKTFCEAMDAMGWKYKKFEEDLVIRCGVNGEDLPMELIICVRKEPKIVGIYSRLPFKAADDKEIDMAVAVSMANYRLIHGNFDYDINQREVVFRIQQFYEGMVISEEACRYLVHCACQTVDDYNDKFFMLNKGMMTIEQFLEYMNNKK